MGCRRDVRRTIILAACTAAALALPPLSSAKELAKAEICGAETCKTITGPALRGLVGGGDGTSQSASPPGPFYRVTLTDRHENGSWSMFYVPAGRRLALPNGDWLRMTEQTATAYRRETARLEPYPTPRLEEVLIDGRAVQDPSSYVALFTVGTTDNAVPSGVPEWIPLHMRFKGETPWSGKPSIYFSAEYGVLQRGLEIVKIPDGMAANIRSGRSIAASDGFPWVIAAVIALALVGVVAGVSGLARRREIARTRRAPIPT